MSVFGEARVASSVSLIDALTIGSSLSVRAFARVGASLSVFDFQHIGSTVSLRSFSRLGSRFSVWSGMRIGSTLSVLSYVNLGSSLALRGFASVGSAISVLGFAHIGSSLSLRSFARFGSDLSISGNLLFSASNTYIRESGSELEVNVAGARAMSLTSSGGTLHGTWSADTVISTSDRRLKRNIKPLMTTFQSNQATGREAGLRGPHAEATTAGAVDWVLRQLRPVSYNFKEGAEAKYMRFGFIADEIEEVLPQIIRTLPSSSPKEDNSEPPELSDKKGIVYPDLIAVLTSMVKEFSSQMTAVKSRLRQAELDLDNLDRQEPVDKPHLV